MKKLICLAIIPIMLVLATACGHEHTFADATCTEPKTCTECGETEGEALGHTVGIGYCSRCKGMAGRDDVELLITYRVSLGNYMDTFGEYINYANNTYSSKDRSDYLVKAAEYLQKHQDTLRSIAYIADKYDEFSRLSRYIDSVLSLDIEIPSSSSKSELYDFLDVAEDYIDKYQYVENEWNVWSKELSSSFGNN